MPMIDKGADPAALEKALARTLAALPGKDVVILLDVPTADRLLPAALALDHHWGRPANWLASNSTSAASQTIRRAARGRARVIDLSAPFCPPAAPCSPLAKGRAVLSDANHLSTSVAADVVAPYLIENGIF